MLPVLPVGEFMALRFIHWGVVTGATSLLAFTAMFYLHSRDSRLRLLVVIPLLHGALISVVPDRYVVDIGNAGQLLCQMLFVVLVVKLLRGPRTAQTWSVAIGLIIMLLAALHDVTLFADIYPERWRWDTPVSYITPPGMLMILAWHGISAFLQASAGLAQLNAQLQQRLAASEERIRLVYAEQESLERQIRIDAERELVYRDLHDDLGARLLSLIYQSERGAAQDLARTALQDLRDIVSRVLATEQSVAAVLADCMAEQLARATALGKDLDWDLAPALDHLACDSRHMLGLRLLLRELVGSALRSPGLLALRADCQWDTARATLTVQLTCTERRGATQASSHACPCCRSACTPSMPDSISTARGCSCKCRLRPLHALRLEPELHFVGGHVEACRVFHMGGHVVPVAHAMARGHAVLRQDEFAAGNDAVVVGVVRVRRNARACCIGSKQDIRPLGLKLVGIETAVKERQLADAVGVLAGHVYLLAWQQIRHGTIARQPAGLQF